MTSPTRHQATFIIIQRIPSPRTKSKLAKKIKALLLNMTMKKYILTILIFSTLSSLKAQRSDVEKYTEEIKEWFHVQAAQIKNSHRFDSIKPFDGKGFSIVILPQTEFMNYLQVGTKRRLGYLEPLPIWSLLNCDNNRNGYIYKELVDSLAIKIIIPSQGTIPFPQNHLDTVSARIAFNPVVFFGQFKRLNFKVSSLHGRLNYNISLIDRKDSVFFDARLLGGESFYDSASATQTEYVFIPRKLNKKKFYVYCQNVQKGSLANVISAKSAISEMEPDDFFEINIKSTPTGCRVYRIGLDIFDLNGSLFDELKKNNYNITPSFLAFLKPEFTITRGGTNTTDLVRKVTYVYFIRNGNKLSEPIIYKPGRQRSNLISWDFTKF